MARKKVEHELLAYIPPDTSPQLKLHTLEYLYDTVGWALYCTGALDNDDEFQEAKPAGQATIDLGEDGEIVRESKPKRPVKKKKKAKKDDPLKPLKVKKEPWDEYRFLRQSLKDIYRTKDEYLNWLRQQYDREIQFYRAILRGEASYSELYPELEELGIFDSDLTDEIQASTRDQLDELNQNLREETAIVKGITDADWEKISSSSNPKITMAVILGAAPKDIKENFQTSLLVRMRAQRMGQRTAFYSWTGPKIWDGLEDFEVQVDSVVDAVLDPIIAYETSGALENNLKKKKNK